MKAHLSPRDFALTLGVVALWGFTFVPIKVGLREMPPFAMAALRFFFASIPLMFFVRRPQMPWRYIAAYGFAIGVFQFGLLFLGMNLGMPAGLSSLVIQLQVFFTIGLGIAFLGERWQRHNMIGAAISAAGLVILGTYKLTTGATGTLTGFFLVIAAALAWAVGNVVAKRAAGEHDADMFALVVWSSIVPPLPLVAISYVFEGGPAAWRAVASAGALSWGCVLFLAWAATLFGFAQWAGLMHRYPTALISPFALLIPVSGIASGALLLGEALAPLQIAGVLLVFAGLVENVYGAGVRARLRRAR
ncbi:MAG: O-acetylserine/cysteine exporter [Betaproteobacteria bacterium]|nr:MAG: O-acetylserine/cysteine exporter [Betaproteobacteria bacterium]